MTSRLTSRSSHAKADGASGTHLIAQFIKHTFVQLYNRFGAERLEMKPPDSIFDDGGFCVVWSG